MPITLAGYTKLRDATRYAGSMLREILIDKFAADPDRTDAGEMFESELGRVFLDNYIAAARRTPGTFSFNPAEPITVNAPPGAPTGSRVLASHDIARELIYILRKFRGRLSTDHPAGVSGGVAAFERSWQVFLGAAPTWHGFFETGSSVERLPNGPDLANSPQGTFGHAYSHIHPSLMTQPTMDIIYVEQLVMALKRLGPKDVDEKLIKDINYAYSKLVTIVSEMSAYALENGALASLQTERIQSRIFDREKNEIGVARMHLNMTSANKLDASGNLGNIFLEAVREWLSEAFPRGHIIQSPERTTFQSLLLAGIDTDDQFKNFAFEVRKKMSVINESKKESDRASPEAIGQFQPRAVIATMPFGRRNILRYAIQNAEDVDLFRDVLIAMGHSGEVLDAIKGVMQKVGGREEVFGYLAVDEEAQSGGHFNVEAVLARNDRRLNRMLQALMLKAIYYFSRELAGTTTYFEKERGGPTDPVAVFTEKDIPTEESEDHRIYREYADAGVGFVSQGAYDPLSAHPELSVPEFLAGMPHMRFAQEHRVSPTEPEIDRLLAIFSRPSHDIGTWSHPAREPLPEVFYREIEMAFNKLYEAKNWEERGPARDEYHNAIRLVDWDYLPPGFKMSLLQMMHATIELRRDETAKGVVKEKFQKILKDLRRMESPGGALERVQKAIRSLAGDKSGAALDNLKRELENFFILAGRIYARAITDPRYPLAFKASREFATGRRTINVDLFSQELARTGWTNIAVFEYDSFKAMMAKLALDTADDYNDATFQVVRDIIFVVAHQWNMDIPLMTPFGGDLNIIAFSDYDKDNLPIDAGAFLAECQRMAAELYGAEFQDTKKVEMIMATFDFSRSLTREAIDRASAAVADELGMQTVPLIAVTKRGIYVLSIPVRDGFNPDVKIEQVRDAFARRGMPMSNLKIIDAIDTARLPIWMEDARGRRRYRFGHARPKNTAPFMKTFSLSAALGTIAAWDTGGYPALAASLSDAVEELKKQFFPHKGGLGFHISARIDADKFVRALEAQVTAFKAHADKLNEVVLKCVEAIVGTKGRIISSDVDVGRLVATLRIKANQMFAFNKSFERRVVESFGFGAGQTSTNIGVGEFISNRQAAAERLLRIVGGLERIFSAGKSMAATDTTKIFREIKIAIKEFRIFAKISGNGDTGGEPAPDDAGAPGLSGHESTVREWNSSTTTGMPVWGEATSSAALAYVTTPLSVPDISALSAMTAMSGFAATASLSMMHI